MPTLDEMAIWRRRYEHHDDAMYTRIDLCLKGLLEMYRNAQKFNEELYEMKAQGEKVPRHLFLPIRQINRLERTMKKVKSIKMSLKRSLKK